MNTESSNVGACFAAYPEYTCQNNKPLDNYIMWVQIIINGNVKINGGLEFLGRKGWGKHFKVQHKGSSKLRITTIGQAVQVQCDNGPKNIPV